jgi:hypothetical protein
MERRGGHLEENDDGRKVIMDISIRVGGEYIRIEHEGSNDTGIVTRIRDDRLTVVGPHYDVVVRIIDGNAHVRMQSNGFGDHHTMRTFTVGVAGIVEEGCEAA